MRTMIASRSSRPEALKRGFVAFQRLLADGQLERRGIVRRFGGIERIGRTAALRAADLVAHAVEQRLAQVGGEGARVARFERIQPLEHLGQRVLDQIVGIQGAASPGRKAAVRPALEPRQIFRAQIVERVGVALASASQQRKRRLRVRGTLGRSHRRVGVRRQNVVHR